MAWNSYSALHAQCTATRHNFLKHSLVIIAALLTATMFQLYLQEYIGCPRRENYATTAVPIHYFKQATIILEYLTRMVHSITYASLKQTQRHQCPGLLMRTSICFAWAGYQGDPLLKMSASDSNGTNFSDFLIMIKYSFHGQL